MRIFCLKCAQLVNVVVQLGAAVGECGTDVAASGVDQGLVGGRVLVLAVPLDAAALGVGDAVGVGCRVGGEFAGDREPVHAGES